MEEMTVTLNEIEMSIAMNCMATRRQQLAQWIEDEEAKPKYDGLAIQEAKNKLARIDSVWKKFNKVDTDNMLKVRATV